MAASGYTPIQLYYSTTAATAPSSSNLLSGELAINILDEKLYFKNSAGTVKLLASNASSSGTVSSVAQSFTGGLISVGGSPITTSGTLALTVAGTSGGIPYFSSASAWASSALLTQYGILYGGGAGASPVATAAGTTGQVLLANTGAAPTWGTVAASLTIGTTAIASGTSGRVLYDNAGTLGEYTVTGTAGSVVLSTAPTFTTTIDGGATFGAFASSTALTLGYTGTGASSTTNLSSAAITGAFTKTINIGTGGTTGSTTAINIGTSVGSTTTITGTVSLGTALPVGSGGTGNATATAYAVLTGGTTSTGAFQSIASVGTTGQVLTSNGAGALPTFQAAAGGFASGTRMSFQQTSAPTGWTKDTTAAINDSILRLVTGSVTSGGTTAFSTWNAQTATGATTLSTAQIPSHTHTYTSWNTRPAADNVSSFAYSPFTDNTGGTGGGGSHTHSLTQSLKYYDFIIASKD